MTFVLLILPYRKVLPKPLILISLFIRRDWGQFDTTAEKSMSTNERMYMGCRGQGMTVASLTVNPPWSRLPTRQRDPAAVRTNSCWCLEIGGETVEF